MKYLLFIIVCGLLGGCSSRNGGKQPLNASGTFIASKVILQSQILPDYYKLILPKNSKREFTELRWMPVEYQGIHTDWNVEHKPLKDSGTKWTIFCEKPLNIKPDFLPYGMLINPGDSVCIKYNGRDFDYSGKGAATLYLQDEIQRLKIHTFIKPTKGFVRIDSVKDYFSWRDYYDKRMQVLSIILDYYKDKVPGRIYNIIKTGSIYDMERERAETFASLYGASDKFRLKPSDLIAIYDSTMNDQWARWLQTQSDYLGDLRFFYQYNQLQLFRKYNFDATNENINSDKKRIQIFYDSFKQNYQGALREQLLQYVITEKVFKDIGFDDPATDVILKDYYAQPGYPEYKKWMMDFEKEKRQRYAKAK